MNKTKISYLSMDREDVHVVSRQSKTEGVFLVDQKQNDPEILGLTPQHT